MPKIVTRHFYTRELLSALCFNGFPVAGEVRKEFWSLGVELCVILATTGPGVRQPIPTSRNATLLRTPGSVQPLSSPEVEKT